jgi:ABC-type uncharacterized transport system involved in gliding motility auxiliary subunit
MNKWIRGTNAAVLSLAVIGIFIILTLFLHSLKGFQADLTKNKNFTLSDQTLSTLKKLDKDIKIIAFTNPQSADPFITRQVSDLAQEYKKLSSKISFEEHDLLKEPSLAKQYGVTDASGVVIFQSGDKQKQVSYYEMFTGGQDPGSYSFSGEEKFTQAIVSLTSNVKHPVYFLSGHNEIPLNQMSVLRSALEGENYDVKELNLLREGKIPDDADILFVIGPQNDISDKETQLINDYLKNKGKIYFAIGFNKDMATAWKNIDSILAAYGVQDQHAVAIEAKQTTLFDPLTIIPEYGYHDITKKLSDYNLLTQISLAVTLNADPNNKDYTPNLLLKTSDQAYGETDINLLMQSKTKKDDKDIKGPLNLAYAIENKDKKPKAVIIGGSTFLHDQDITQQGNKDFALNSVNWLEEQKDQVTIRPRQGDAYQQAMILPSQANWIFIGTIILFPLFFLFIGGLIWWRRRKG